MTGDARRMELVIMRGETEALIRTWRGRGIDWDTVAARLAQASLDVAGQKHADRRGRGNGVRR